MPQDSVIPGTPEHWLARADGHLALARQPKPPAGFWEDFCFHAQQAAELAFKAVYQHRGLVFRFTHDLETLEKGLEDAGMSMPIAVRKAARLTRYAVLTRYPGLAPPVSQEECEEAVRFAKAVVNWARETVANADAP